MTTMIINGEEVPNAEEYIQQLEADIVELKKRRTLESGLADYWYERCVMLNTKAQNLEEGVEELNRLHDVESTTADYWYKRYMELKNEM